MKYRKNIYCEKKFIELCINRQEDNPTEYSPLLNKIKEILNSPYIKLYIDISEEEYDTIEKSMQQGVKRDLSKFEYFLYELCINQKNGEIQIKHYEKIDFEKLDLIDLNAYYFTCEDNEKCKRIMDDYGVLAINVDNLTQFGFALCDNGVAIAKKERNSWEQILGTINKLPYNSLIIIDNYLLNDTNLMDDNLKGILESMIPLKIKVPFNITIFTKLRTDKGSDLPIKPRIEKIKSMLKDYPIELCIFKNQSFHDRIVLTNSMLIGCPGGFDLFKAGISQKTTTLNVTCPILGNNNIKWAAAAYSNFVSEALNAYKSAPEYGNNGINDSYTEFFYGTKKNRIIEGSNSGTTK